MSHFASATTVLAALAILAAAILYARLAAAWRIAHDSGRLRLVQMLARHAAPEQALGTGACDAAFAMRRCMMCPQQKACDRWLASEARSGIDTFCPNAEFIARVAASK